MHKCRFQRKVLGVGGRITLDLMRCWVVSDSDFPEGVKKNPLSIVNALHVPPLVITQPNGSLKNCHLCEDIDRCALFRGKKKLREEGWNSQLYLFITKPWKVESDTLRNKWKFNSALNVCQLLQFIPFATRSYKSMPALQTNSLTEEKKKWEVGNLPEWGIDFVWPRRVLHSWWGRRDFFGANGRAKAPMQNNILTAPGEKKSPISLPMTPCFLSARHLTATSQI